MNRVISQIEQIIADIGFTGLASVHSGIIAAVDRTAALCSELEMGLGESLCRELCDMLLEGDGEKAAEIFCRLCFYCESISN